jgi:hypothetical protein
MGSLAFPARWIWLSKHAFNIVAIAGAAWDQFVAFDFASCATHAGEAGSRPICCYSIVRIHSGMIERDSSAASTREWNDVVAV